MKTFMKTLLIRTTVATAGLVLCVAVQLYLVAVGGWLSLIAPLLIFILALILRLRFGWGVLEMLTGLLPLEIFMLHTICRSVGKEDFPLFPPKLAEFGYLYLGWDWFFYLNLFLGLPWLAGIAVGSVGSALRKGRDNAG
jgi:hypothetical protein